MAGRNLIPIEKGNLPQYVLKSSRYGQISNIKFPNKYFFLRESIKCNSSYEAFLQIMPIVERFRGLLEFSIGKYSTRIFSSQQQPLRKISEPPFIIIISNRIDWNIYQVDIDETFNNKYTLVKREQMEKFHNNLALFEQYPKLNSTNELILNSLVLYIKALDARFNYEIFLSFWQLAEILMNSELFGGQTKIMATRFKHFSRKLIADEIGLDYSIDALAEKRKAIVHSGHTTVSNGEIKLIKILCDLMISWMIGVSNNLKTVNHLDDYFKFKDFSDNKLSTLYNVLEYITKQRK